MQPSSACALSFSSTAAWRAPLPPPPPLPLPLPPPLPLPLLPLPGQPSHCEHTRCRQPNSPRTRGLPASLGRGSGCVAGQCGGAHQQAPKGEGAACSRVVPGVGRPPRCCTHTHPNRENKRIADKWFRKVSNAPHLAAVSCAWIHLCVNAATSAARVCRGSQWSGCLQQQQQPWRGVGVAHAMPCNQ